MAARAGETTTKIVPVQAGAMTSALSLFPLPHQLGPPYFDRINVTEFLARWEDLTMDGTDGQRIKKMPLFCETTLGLYIKELDIYRDGESWDDFTIVLKLEFREDDSEQMRNTETYLQSLVQKMRKENDPSIAVYRTFIFEFARRSNFLVAKLVINEHTRIVLFLQAFPDKIGDKLCNRCKIDIDDTSSTAHVWSELKKETLNICTKDDSYMSKFWKTKKQLETSPVKPIPKMREEQQPRLEEVGPTLLSRGRSAGPLDEVTKMMKDFQLSQVEAQKRFENELAFLRDVFTKVLPPASAHTPAPYYPPRQCGNREYPRNQGSQMNHIRDCYWDGLMHRKEECQDLKQAIARGEVHQRDTFT